jgi:hypothetical protein
VPQSKCIAGLDFDRLVPFNNGVAVLSSSGFITIEFRTFPLWHAIFLIDLPPFATAVNMTCHGASAFLFNCNAQVCSSLIVHPELL